jgi:hypothetical protein
MIYRWLFPTPGPLSNTNKFDLKLDPTMGGSKGKGGSNLNEVNNDDPNQNSFGLYLLSGKYNTFH